MKKILLSLVLSLGAMTLSQVHAEETMMCTQQYAPVCGEVQVQCFAAPCNPVKQTFGNACMAAAAKATNVTQGKCGSTGSVIVGGDVDLHGCKASAGYSWDDAKKQCTRPWEGKMSPQQALKAGTWFIKSFNGKDITSSGSITFAKNNTFSAQVCNSMRGHFGATQNRIFVRNVVSTMMYCGTDIMPVENAMSFTRARYYVGSNELKFITNKGDTFIWTR
jgi:heat shock protein HslJ